MVLYNRGRKIELQITITKCRTQALHIAGQLGPDDPRHDIHPHIDADGTKKRAGIKRAGAKIVSA